MRIVGQKPLALEHDAIGICADQDRRTGFHRLRSVCRRERANSAISARM